jgi:hypothetical protein
MASLMLGCVQRIAVVTAVVVAVLTSVEHMANGLSTVTLVFAVSIACVSVSLLQRADRCLVIVQHAAQS